MQTWILHDRPDPATQRRRVTLGCGPGLTTQPCVLGIADTGSQPLDGFVVLDLALAHDRAQFSRARPLPLTGPVEHHENATGCPSDGRQPTVTSRGGLRLCRSYSLGFPLVEFESSGGAFPGRLARVSVVVATAFSCVHAEWWMVPSSSSRNSALHCGFRSPQTAHHGPRPGTHRQRQPRHLEHLVANARRPAAPRTCARAAGPSAERGPEAAPTRDAQAPAAGTGPRAPWSSTVGLAPWFVSHTCRATITTSGPPLGAIPRCLLGSGRYSGQNGVQISRGQS